MGAGRRVGNTFIFRIGVMMPEIFENLKLPQRRDLRSFEKKGVVVCT